MHIVSKRLGLVSVGVDKGRWGRGRRVSGMGTPLRVPSESRFLRSHLVTAIHVFDVLIFL